MDPISAFFRWRIVRASRTSARDIAKSLRRRDRTLGIYSGEPDAVLALASRQWLTFASSYWPGDDLPADVATLEAHPAEYLTPNKLASLLAFQEAFAREYQQPKSQVKWPEREVSSAGYRDEQEQKSLLP